MTSPVTVWAGPILRRLQPNRITIWLATAEPVTPELTLFTDSGLYHILPASVLSAGHQQIKAGVNLHFQLFDLKLEIRLPVQQAIYYNLQLNGQGWKQWAPDLNFTPHSHPFFVLQPKLSSLLHGSCRKPHFAAADGLLRAEQLLASTSIDDWPALLMLSGDQVYVDDVATPMLMAIHQFIPRLGLPDESLHNTDVSLTSTLHSKSPYYLKRETLLPDDKKSNKVLEQLFKGARKPVFTSDNAHNHLISLAEMFAMYLLVWSPVGWQQLTSPRDLTPPADFNTKQCQQFICQAEVLDAFIGGLSAIRRLLAHLPVAMIFDDHDITDDWNLTAAWELAAYQHPLSKRIIGNALLAYLLFQGWGNCPEQFPATYLSDIQQQLCSPGSNSYDVMLDQLLRFNHWYYQWPTEPALVVLDTRTQRWRSERSIHSPSGLMDWEALSNLQQKLVGLDAVVLVSAAPIFGVKLIEAIQRIFTWLGKPLLVDAENWMAHRGTAYTLLNMFRHPKTPKHFVILSGDVHYSFVYDIRLRSQTGSPAVWQITSSGLKNEFPGKLLQVFDRLNRWLYSPRSPLNWLTRRRRMLITPHQPESAQPGERLLNAAGIGLVKLNEDGSPAEVIQLCADGRNIEFKLYEDEARWH